MGFIYVMVHGSNVLRRFALGERSTAVTSVSAVTVYPFIKVKLRLDFAFERTENDYQDSLRAELERTGTSDVCTRTNTILK